MKYISVLGDSISTFYGFNPPGYAVYYEEMMQAQNGLKGVQDTWWAQVIQALDGVLCVNNSYSGSLVSGAEFPAGCHDERLLNMKKDGKSPDIILIYFGYNDFGNGIDPQCFEDAYVLMLQKLKKYYPAAKILCATLMRTALRGREEWEFPECLSGVPLEAYNQAIRRAVQQCGCLSADIGALGCRYETLDGAHPTAKGHAALADAWLQCIKTQRLN